MFKFSRNAPSEVAALVSSKLYDQDSFYPALLKDLKSAKQLVIIESPFLTLKRVNVLLPTVHELRKRGVQVIINTKPTDEHDTSLSVQATRACSLLQELGVIILNTVGHHRKIVLIDDHITWEGSLNVLSQNDSCEFMRRIDSKQLTAQMLSFLNLDKFLG